MQRDHAIPRAMPRAMPVRHSSAKEMSDHDLVRLIAADDNNAMRILFARHNMRVFRFAVRIVGNEATAEDVVSDVFLDVWRNASRFEGRSQVATWILGIARHKALAAARRRPIGESDDDIAFIVDHADGPETAAQKADRSAILRDCLEQLTPAHREIIDLVYYHEQTIDDVARILGVPLNTVKTRMFYARKRIAALLAARGIEQACL
jgi:RNA polymerase sigma-70 factor (ECF subfamily)